MERHDNFYTFYCFTHDLRFNQEISKVWRQKSTKEKNKLRKEFKNLQNQGKNDRLEELLKADAYENYIKNQPNRRKYSIAPEEEAPEEEASEEEKKAVNLVPPNKEEKKKAVSLVRRCINWVNKLFYFHI